MPLYLSQVVFFQPHMLTSHVKLFSQNTMHTNTASGVSSVLAP